MNDAILLVLGGILFMQAVNLLLLQHFIKTLRDLLQAMHDILAGMK